MISWIRGLGGSLAFIICSLFLTFLADGLSLQRVHVFLIDVCFWWGNKVAWRCDPICPIHGAPGQRKDVLAPPGRYASVPIRAEAAAAAGSVRLWTQFCVSCCMLWSIARAVMAPCPGVRCAYPHTYSCSLQSTTSESCQALDLRCSVEPCTVQATMSVSVPDDILGHGVQVHVQPQS